MNLLALIPVAGVQCNPDISQALFFAPIDISVLQKVCMFAIQIV